MPETNWEVFTQLPGAAETNFEKLCRALVRRHYGRFGHFKELANQAGVEFHLQLTQSCELGAPPQWIGWQCKWYQLERGKALGTNRRAKIREGIEKTREHIPGVNVWKLWTRHPLTRADQNWFYGLADDFPGLTLELLTADDIDDLLTGPGALLRASYFGELVLSPMALAEQYRLAAAPFKRRYQPEVHVVGNTERQVQRLLGGAGAWGRLTEIASALLHDAAVVATSIAGLPQALEQQAQGLLTYARGTAGLLRALHMALEAGHFDGVHQLLGTHPPEPIQFRPLLSRLRSARFPAALSSTNLVADLHSAALERQRLEKAISLGAVAILAGAGQGKSELAVRLTQPDGDFPGGVLLLGKNLHARQGLDDLVAAFKIAGQPPGSFERLAEAVDAAGQRAGQRLPIVIDGLNEAEDPRVWRDELARAQELLQAFPYVLLIVTLRDEFAPMCLPEDLPSVEHRGFDMDRQVALDTYFRHYRIDATDVELPLEFLQHPLTLRIYCEVANPTRAQLVGVEALPNSLTALFDEHFKRVAARIADLAPSTHRIHQDEVQEALLKIAGHLWEHNARSMEFQEARSAINQGAPWDQSMLCALESADVLIRTSQAAEDQGVAFPYDLMAGHLQARYLLTKPELASWLRSAEAEGLFQHGPYQSSHTFGRDVLQALVSLYPSYRQGRQLWQDLPDSLQQIAVLMTVQSDPAHIRRETVERFGHYMAASQEFSKAAFGWLRRTRAARGHPYDVSFLHGVLAGWSNTRRDLWWSDWLLREADTIEEDLKSLAARWEAAVPDERDIRRARWVMWTLTTTSRHMRDLATKALFQFALARPAEYFRLAIDALGISDPYVPERVLAAGYGAALSTWSDPNACEMRTALPQVAPQIVATMFHPDAPHPSWHALLRQYALGIIALARQIDPGCIAHEDASFLVAPFVHLPSPFDQLPAYEEAAIEEAADSAIRMDFGNYTMGRLIPDRANYDDEHPVYQQVRRAVVARMLQLGYDPEQFDPVDHGTPSRSRMHEPGKIDRFGKKYGWIAYFEMWGTRHARGLLDEDRDGRPSDADIDPTFPPEARTLALPTGELFAGELNDIGAWIMQGPSPDYRHMLILDQVDGMPGPWVALDGFIEENAPDDDRQVFTFLRGVLVASSKVRTLGQVFDDMEYPGNYAIPEQPEHHYTYAGEMPFKEIPGLTDAPRHVRMDGRYRDGTASDDDEFEEEDDRYEPDQQPRVGERGWGSGGVPVELPVQQYCWESYHSALNTAGTTSLPSTALCEGLGLSFRAGQWDLHDTRGAASIYRQVSRENAANDKRVTGWICFLRADLLERYLQENGMSLVWLMWGERGLHHRASRNHSLREFFANHKHIHKRRDIYRFARSGTVDQLAPSAP